ncbi:MAG: hypothetical protein A2583_02560 [Bdellovibrionales bacterium RIFOXYD1_FULL_53_11]|nr:MAG: hypothetical protein A2583_02560 [Bdellovibrionales bacterium RIFOXYD1_FULL_53_11]
MAVAKLCKVHAVVDSNRIGETMRLAALMNCFHPVEVPVQDIQKADPGKQLASLGLLRKRIEDIAGAINAGLHCKTSGKCLDEIDSYCTTHLVDLEKTARTLQENEKQARREKLKNEQIAAKLKYLVKLDVNTGDLKKFNFIRVVFGRIPRRRLKELTRLLSDKDVIVHEFERKAYDVFLILFMRKESSGEVLTSLREILFEEYPLPDNIEGQPKKALETAARNLQLANIALERAELEKRELLLLHGDTLKLAYDMCLNTITVKEAQKELRQSSRLSVLSGYVPEYRLGEFHKTVESTAGDTAIIFTEAAGPGAPTLLKNNKFLKPFEMLVEMFGRPSYHEVDPTPFLAVSFVTMFGMMFGDIGHGLVFVIAGLLMKYKWKAGATSLIPVCMGGSSMLFGLLYGDLFGFKLIHPPLWIDPMHDTMYFLYFTAALGVALMTIGLVINLVNTWRIRNLEDFLFSKNGIAGIFMYLGTLTALFLLGIKVGPAFVVVVWLVPIILMFFKEPLGHLIKGKKHLFPENKTDFFIGSFFELLDTLLGYLSNTISFVRIAAFAMNHIGLFAVVTLLTKMIDAGSYDSFADGIIIICGNIFIILLEGFIVTIQVLRLEYYEFFSKFFEAKGNPFKAVSFERKREA